MTSPPEWLPEMINVDGEWSDVVGRLYSIFYKDFKQHQPQLKGMPVWHDRRILPGESYEEAFWHLITKDKIGEQRGTFEPRRSERLPWCRAVIENSHDSDLSIWTNDDGKKGKTIYVWLLKFDYVVVLRKRFFKKGNIAFLITAFYIEGESKRRNLRKKYERRLA